MLITAQGQMITVGSTAWRHWLDDAHTTTFRIVHPLATLTACKEHGKRGGAYWYAYHKRAGRLYKGYLGRAQDLTLQRLDDMATRLANRPETRQHEQAATTSAAPAPGPHSPMLDHALAPDALDALLATKLYLPPPRRGLVPRPRLTTRLEAGLHGPLTLLVAPAGWGKTTVLGEWRARQHKDASPLSWLTLDAGDNDLARFLRYVVAAFQTLQADLGHAVLAGLRAPQPPPVEALLTLLINDLTTLSQDAVLVLDDYHVITLPAIHQALIFLLEHLPPRVHLAIATRAEPPLPLARLRARGHLTELRAADLRFTIEEAATFLQQAVGYPLAADDVATLESRTEGWIAGLRLAALALREHDPAQLSALIAPLTGTHHFIFDYLADEVFARQPAGVQHFLLRTSVLDRLSGPLCDALTAESNDVRAVGESNNARHTGKSSDKPHAGDGQTMLERLEAANLFVVPLDDTRTWYRYHHLFADFLRERLRREETPLLSDLHRRASHWLAQHELAAQAAEHALAAGDDAQAARLIEQVSSAMMWQHGELTTLRWWLERLPREVTRSRSRLSLDLAWALLWSAQLDAVEPRLHDVEEGLAGTTPIELAPAMARRALAGEMAAIRAELARQRGELATAITLAHRALADLPTQAQQVRGVTIGLLGGAYLSSGDAVAASQAYEDALAASQAAGTMTLALFAGGRLVQAQALHGQLRQAATTYRRTLELAAGHGLAATPAVGVAQVGMGEVLRERNNREAADDLLREGIARCAGVGGLAEVALEGCLTLARVLQARGDAAGALAAFDRAETLGYAGHVPQSAERVATARVRLWLTTTPVNLAQATRWAKARRTDEQFGYTALLAQLTLARLLLMDGTPEEAAILLQPLLTQAEAGGLTGKVIEILVLQARASLGQDQPAQAMIALGRALALAELEGYLRVFLDEGAPMVALLQQAQMRGVAPAYVATLLAAGGAKNTVNAEAATQPDPLSAREVELLRLVATGLSAREAAAQLFITAGTARIHLKHIYRKLDVHNRVQAVERARALGLV